MALDSFAQLPDLLIRARVAAGLTRRALAERLGLEEYEVWHYEETRYADVGLDRLRAVAEALGLRRQACVTLPAAAPIPVEIQNAGPLLSAGEDAALCPQRGEMLCRTRCCAAAASVDASRGRCSGARPPLAPLTRAV